MLQKLRTINRIKDLYGQQGNIIGYLKELDGRIKYEKLCNLPPKAYKSIGGFLRPDLPSNRQQLPTYYRLNGAIFLAAWRFIRKRDNWYGPRTYAYIMPRERSVDIDEGSDMALAEFLAQSRRD